MIEQIQYIQQPYYLQQPTGSLLITSVPSKAKIFIDEEQISTTPAFIENIPVGIHSYRLVRPGYIDIMGIVYIEQDQIRDVFLKMEGLISREFIVAAAASLTAGIIVYLFTRRRIIQ